MNRGYVLIFTLNLILILIVFFYFKRKVIELKDSRNFLKEVRDEVDRIIVELNQTTAQNIALIEERINTLKRETERAERVISLISRERGRRNTAASGYEKIMKKSQSGKGHVELPKEEDINEKVLKLYNSGLSETLIAKEVGLPVGEIQLIVSLNKRR